MLFQELDNIVLIQLSDMDSNVYLIGDTIIDSGTGFNFTRLRDVLRVLKKDLKDIKQIINTHGHFDHIGGNGYFMNAKVFIHKLDAPIIEKGDTELSAADFFDGKLHPRNVENKLNDGDRITTKNMDLEVIHTPGHTNGSICLYNEKDKILFSGDTVFANGVGRTDFINSDPKALAESLERISKLDVKKILPGHGPVFDKKNISAVMKNVNDDFF